MMRNKLSSVRQSNPAFKNMTDDQMRQYADQMELGRLMICYQSTNLLCYAILCYAIFTDSTLQAADDPAMMKEIEIERMSHLIMMMVKLTTLTMMIH